MTNQKAIEIMKDELICYTGECQKRIPCTECTEPTSEEIAQAYKIAVAAMEKREPMEPEKIECDEGLTISYFCPVCKRYLGQRGKHSVILFNKETFCQNPYCGQALDWKGE